MGVNERMKSSYLGDWDEMLVECMLDGKKREMR